MRYRGLSRCQLSSLLQALEDATNPPEEEVEIVVAKEEEGEEDWDWLRESCDVLRVVGEVSRMPSRG